MNAERDVPEARRASAAGLVAAGSAGATMVAYLAIIGAQGNIHDPFRIAFVAAYIAVLAAAAAVGAVTHRPVWGRSLRWFSAGGLLSMGVIGLFSIGIFLLVAGGCALTAAVRSPKTEAGIGMPGLWFFGGVIVTFLGIVAS